MNGFCEQANCTVKCATTCAYRELPKSTRPLQIPESSAAKDFMIFLRGGRRGAISAQGKTEDEPEGWEVTSYEGEPGTKPNETKQNEIKRNETKRNE